MMRQTLIDIELLQILQNILLYQIIRNNLNRNHYSKIHDDKAIFDVQNLCKNVQNHHV